MTTFQKRIYEATSQIPKGKVVSYDTLARYVACRSPQAVGQALKRNPSPPQIPCHRVIQKTGFIGGYLGVTSAQGSKYELLTAEGIKINHHGYISSDTYWWSWE